MSPLIQADFSTISSSFQPVDAGAYICRVKDIKYDMTSTKKNRITFELEIDDPSHPEHKGHPLYDRVILEKNDGNPNMISYGRIKAYGEATLGIEAANNPQGLDTDAFKNGMVMAEVGVESYDYIPADAKLPDGSPDPSKRKTGTSNDVKRILPII